MWATGGVFDPATMPDDGGMGTISIDSGASSEGVPAHPYLIVLAPLALASSTLALLMLLGPTRFRNKGHSVLGSISGGVMLCAALVVLFIGLDDTPSDPIWPVLVPTALIVICALMGAAALRMGGRPWTRKGHLSLAAGAMAGLVWCLLSLIRL